MQRTRCEHIVCSFPPLPLARARTAQTCTRHRPQLGGASASARSLRTALVFSPRFLEHHTAEHMRRRVGVDPPPENTERLRVLCDEGIGTLRSLEMNPWLEWIEDFRDVHEAAKDVPVSPWQLPRQRAKSRNYSAVNPRSVSAACSYFAAAAARLSTSF